MVIIALTSIFHRALQTSYFRFFSMADDAAAQVGFIESVRLYGQYDATMLNSFQGLGPTRGWSAEMWCEQGLVTDTGSSFSIFETHAYFLHYFLGYLAKILDFSILKYLHTSVLSLNLFIVGSWFLALTVLFLFIKKRSTHKLAPIILIVFVLTQPLVSFQLNGLTFVTKGFILPAVISLIILVKKSLTKTDFSLIALMQFLASLIDERSSLLSGVVTFIFIMLNKEINKKDRRMQGILVLCLLQIAWFFYWAKFVQININYTDALNIENIFFQLRNSFSINGLLPLTINLGIANLTMLMFILISRRIEFIVPALVSILPNLLISGGGVEKDQFWTQYHSNYFPYLIIFSIFSILSFMKSKKSNLVLFAVTLSIGINLIHPVDEGQGIKKLSSNIRGIQNSLGLTNKDDLNYLRQIANERDKIVADIKPGSLISAAPWIMPSLVANGNIFINQYPRGIKDAEYAFAEYDFNKQKYVVHPWYYNEITTLAIGKCVAEAINRREVLSILRIENIAGLYLMRINFGS